MRCNICGKPVGSLAKTIKISQEGSPAELELYVCPSCQGIFFSTINEIVKHPNHQRKNGNIIRNLLQNRKK